MFYAEQPVYSPQIGDPSHVQQLTIAGLSDLGVPLYDRFHPSLANLSGSGLPQVSAPASESCYSGRSGIFGTSKEIMTQEQQQEYVYLIPADGVGGIHFTNDDTYYSINDFLSAFNTNPSSPLCEATLEEKSEKTKGGIATNYWRVVCKKPITQEMFNKVGNEYERGDFYIPEKGLKGFLACQDTSGGEELPSENPVIENPQPDPDTQPTKTLVHTLPPSDQPDQTDTQKAEQSSPENSVIPDNDTSVTEETGTINPDDLDAAMVLGGAASMAAVGGMLLYRRRRKYRPGVPLDLNGYTNPNAPASRRPKTDSLAPVSQPKSKSFWTIVYPWDNRQSPKPAKPPSWYNDPHSEVLDGNLVHAHNNKHKWH